MDTGKLCMGEGYTPEVIRNLMYGIIDSLDSVSSERVEGEEMKESSSRDKPDTGQTAGTMGTKYLPYSTVLFTCAVCSRYLT